MPPLDGAVSLVKVDVVAVGIAEYLHLDVSGSGDVLLDQHPVIGEGVQRLPLATLQGLHKLFRVVDDSHTLASSSRHCFDQHGVVHLVGLGK